MKPIVHGEVKNLALNLNGYKEKLKAIQETFNGTIFSHDGNEEVNILVLLSQAINYYKKEIFGLALLEYMKLPNNQNNDLILWVPFELEFKGCFIKDQEEKLIKMTGGTFKIKVELTFTIPKQITGRSIKHDDGSIKAESVNMHIKEGLESHLVIKNNNEIDFFVTENQQTRKLQTLLTYDPKTDTFTKG